MSVLICFGQTISNEKRSYLESRKMQDCVVKLRHDTTQLCPFGLLCARNWEHNYTVRVNFARCNSICTKSPFSLSLSLSLSQKRQSRRTMSPQLPKIHIFVI